MYHHIYNAIKKNMQKRSKLNQNWSQHVLVCIFYEYIYFFILAKFLAILPILQYSNLSDFHVFYNFQPQPLTRWLFLA